MSDRKGKPRERVMSAVKEDLPPPQPFILTAADLVELQRIARDEGTPDRLDDAECNRINAIERKLRRAGLVRYWREDRAGEADLKLQLVVTEEGHAAISGGVVSELPPPPDSDPADACVGL